MNNLLRILHLQEQKAGRLGILQVCPTYLLSLNDLKIGYINKREKGLFQRRFYEHTILNQSELNNHINYIHYNPVKHGYVKSVKDWEYSSFHKFVKNGLYDIRQIVT